MNPREIVGDATLNGKADVPGDAQGPFSEVPDLYYIQTMLRAFIVIVVTDCFSFHNLPWEKIFQCQRINL